MAQGNKGFAGLVIGAGEGGFEPRRPPKTGILGARENRLSELATGGVVTRVHESVDPALCRIWEGHNRDYAALNETVCADLIDSLRSQGRQEVPAIVRRIQGDPTHRFEVICGARRHWSVSWLRAHDYPEFKFLVEPRELSDEEAFRVADLENRSRKDLSDYERATDYARAIERYYDGSQQRMVERLAVTKSWLSRYLELAKLPEDILACFETPHVIGISHAASLAPALTHPNDRRRVLDEASILKAEQAARIAAAKTPLRPADVVARLLAAKTAKAPARARRPIDIRDGDGKLIVSVEHQPKGNLVITVPSSRVGDSQAVLEAIERCLADIGPRPMIKVRSSASRDRT